MKIAVFPGSFDPITLGHVNIIERSLPLFDEIVVAVGYNSTKASGLFTIDERLKQITSATKHLKNIKIVSYEGLTIDFCKTNNVSTIIRGLRNTVDFEFEKSIAQMNKNLAPEIETIFLFTDPKLAAINSSIVRDIIRNGGDANQFLPFEL